MTRGPDANKAGSLREAGGGSRRGIPSVARERGRRPSCHLRSRAGGGAAVPCPLRASEEVTTHVACRSDCSALDSDSAARLRRHRAGGGCLAGWIGRRGHRVTLFAPPGSRSPAEVRSPLSAPHPDEIQFSMWEVDHVARASTRSTPRRPTATVRRRPRPHRVRGARHGRTGSTRRSCTRSTARSSRICSGSTRAMAPRGSWSRSARTARRRAARACATDRGGAQPTRRREWPFAETPGDYLLWIARINDDKGPQRAIAAARAAEHAARPRRAGPPGPGGVLRPRGRAAHRRRRACATSARSATTASASCTRAPARC